MSSRNAFECVAAVVLDRAVTHHCESQRSVASCSDVFMRRAREMRPTSLRERPARISAPVPPSGARHGCHEPFSAHQTGLSDWRSDGKALHPSRNDTESAQIFTTRYTTKKG